MPAHPHDLVPLLEATDTLQATLAQSTLEGAGIRVVLQGQNAGSIDPRLGLIAGIRVLVQRQDLSRAHAILEASRPVLEGPTGATLEGAVCAVHEQPATGTCDRCGAFLCPRCGTLGEPPVCEDCIAHQDEAPRPTGLPRSLVKAVAAVPLLVLGVGLLATLVLGLARALGR